MADLWGSVCLAQGTLPMAKGCYAALEKALNGAERSRQHSAQRRHGLNDRGEWWINTQAVKFSPFCTSDLAKHGLNPIMTIKLPVSEEQALVVAIAEGLPSVIVSYGRFLFKEKLEWVISCNDLLSEETNQKIIKYLGPNGLQDFIRSEIQNQLYAEQDVDNDSEVRILTTISGFTNPLASAKQIVAKLKGVPYRYRATVALPSVFSKNFVDIISGVVALSPTVFLCKGGDLPQTFPVSSNIKRIDSLLFSLPFSESKIEEKRDLDDGKVYMTAIIISYGFYNNCLNITQELGDHLRAFYGACRALGVINTQYSPEEELVPMIMAHEENGEREILSTEELDSDLFPKYRLNSEKFFSENNNKDPIKFENLIKKIAAIFKDEGASRRLYTACIWYYRCLLSQRPLDKLLESTIAMEVMLGERDAAEGLGLTKLLGNRCAYLLGKSHSHRNKIMDDFNAVYRLRSSIVHAGKHKIDAHDRPAVDTAERLCGMIIAKELELMI